MQFRKYLAELIATFGFVFLAAGSVLTNQFVESLLGNVGIALAHGLALMAMVFVFAGISGAHINPAVTIAMWSRSKIKTNDALGYIISQLIGSAIAAFCLWLIFPLEKILHLGGPALGINITFIGAILIEAVLTFFLALIVFEVSDKNSIGIAIGAFLAAAVLVAGPLTGAALNPARAFGPALISGFWKNHLVYWIGPVAGALLAGWIHSFIKKK
ncbi:aquaporin [Candidatus Woesearchaeota archaeon]|nr:aquaporin [Candidatus Woesearchaeota archaeon]